MRLSKHNDEKFTEIIDEDCGDCKFVHYKIENNLPDEPLKSVAAVTSGRVQAPTKSLQGSEAENMENSLNPGPNDEVPETRKEFVSPQGNGSEKLEPDTENTFQQKDVNVKIFDRDRLATDALRHAITHRPHLQGRSFVIYEDGRFGVAQEIVNIDRAIGKGAVAIASFFDPGILVPPDHASVDENEIIERIVNGPIPKELNLTWFDWVEHGNQTSNQVLKEYYFPQSLDEDHDKRFEELSGQMSLLEAKLKELRVEKWRAFDEGWAKVKQNLPQHMYICANCGKEIIVRHRRGHAYWAHGLYGSIYCKWEGGRMYPCEIAKPLTDAQGNYLRSIDVKLQG